MLRDAGERVAGVAEGMDRVAAARQGEIAGRDTLAAFRG